jgi:acyl-CoA synthetase (NDP forming)
MPMTASQDWVKAAFDPASIAVIGASDQPDKIGGRPIKYMLQHGYRGRLYPVNPQRAEVQGVTCFASVDALPEVPELAVIAVPGAAALDAVKACASRGVKLGVVISSGFAETGEAGAQAQREMVRIAREGGMRLVGPNTQGTVNFATGAIASFATLIGEIPPADGQVAIVSQSGAMSMVPYAFLREEGIGVRHSHATGNECDLTVADFAWAAAGDAGVKLVLLYLESVPDPARLAQAAARARENGIPMLAVKAGVSARGQAAASSHTGAVATEEKMLDAFLAQNGIVRMPDMRSLVRSAKLWLQGRAMPGPRVAAISNSGASCVLAADAAERHGLQMQPFAPDLQASLAEVLPGFASVQNPVDLTAALLGNSGLFGQVLPRIAQAQAADGYFISLPMSGKGYDVPRFASDARAFADETGRPVVLAAPLRATRDAFEAAGIPAFAHDEDAMAALGDLARGAALSTEAARLSAFLPPPPGEGRGGGSAPIPPTSGFLSEFDSLSLIERLGIPVTPHALCRTPADLDAALATIPGPWVLKICSAAIPHKSEYGLVKVGLRTPDDVKAAHATLLGRCREHGFAFDGVILATMCKGRRELVVGARWDPAFGAVVMAGDGGTYVEAMPDVVTAVWPFDAQHFARRLAELRIAPLWAGVRGEQPLPRQALAEAAVALCGWLAAHNGRVASADINPLMAAADGRLVAVDALVEVSSTA